MSSRLGRSASTLFVVTTMLLIGSGCARRGVKGDTLQYGEVASGRIDEESERWDDDPAALFTFQGKRDERVLVEVRTTGKAVPDSTLLYRGKVIATSVKPYFEEVTLIDAALPADGEYLLAVHTRGFKLKEPTYSVVVKRDRDLEATRAGDFHLGHADREHLWLFDFAGRQRTGDLVKVKRTEFLAELVDDYRKYAQHSTTLELEVNCREGTWRATGAFNRELNESRRHSLVPVPVPPELRGWAPLPDHGSPRALLCDRDAAAGHLRWTDLDLARDAWKLARKHAADERRSPYRAPEGTPSLQVGEKVSGELVRDEESDHEHRLFRLPVERGERFEIAVEAAFKPYVRVLNEEDYLESTFDAMASGRATPVGRTVKSYGRSEMLIEVRSLEATDGHPGAGAFTLTAKRLPKDPAWTRVGISVRRLLQETRDGKDARGRLMAWRETKQSDLFTRKRKIESALQAYETEKASLSAAESNTRRFRLHSEAEAYGEAVKEFEKELQRRERTELEGFFRKLRRVRDLLNEAHRWELFDEEEAKEKNVALERDVTEDVVRAFDAAPAP